MDRVVRSAESRRQTMLSHLYIKNFAIVPELELEFREGFTAITGETGAGKSILVDALGLLLGERSDSSWVRQGEDRAELTAEFQLADNEQALSWLASGGLDSDGQCLLRRSISSSGRSRAWINGTPVTLQQLAELGDLLVEIHGQNEHVRLTRPARQFELLDGSGNYGKQLDSVASAHERWKELHAQIKACEQQDGASPQELEYLKFQHAELEAQALTAGELEVLEQEHRKLARGGALLEALGTSGALLESEQHGGAQQALLAAAKGLEPYRQLDPVIDSAANLLSEAAINCQEAAVAIRQASDRVDLSPERLAVVSDQLSALADLARKHRAAMEELDGVRDRLSKRIEGIENFESRRNEMEARCAAALSEYRQAAAGLSSLRSQHAKKLSGKVSDLMAELGMPGGVLEIRIESDATALPSARGDDRIELLVSANPGTLPGPLSRIASGGELSRISLAIKAAASYGQAPGTQVFDEVDAGIGGDTANAVGRLLQKLSAGTQSFCVTHLAQVAVCADQQVQVRKESRQDQTIIGTATLGEEDRVDEIARMLGGRVSDQSRRHAFEMLHAARGN